MSSIALTEVFPNTNFNHHKTPGKIRYFFLCVSVTTGTYIDKIFIAFYGDYHLTCLPPLLDCQLREETVSELSSELSS